MRRDPTRISVLFKWVVYSLRATDGQRGISIIDVHSLPVPLIALCRSINKKASI
ncbi:hypothetical protein PAXRUDRAFT_827195 [Paxillus rubicundulus Ve08.2h10]|uniref:Uncharacterized protein n=1 Tax=Paxillus rubicundulus Ve08.2h10 TaxID=930991 RepID=A0A0D0DR22_9AGAM|nr:hypothetical protein PAXRUDRAFT_827195 [Paxillus rubicundulus Ve08.2h10]